MAHRAKDNIPESGAGVPDDVKRLAEWGKELGWNRLTDELMAGRFNSWRYDRETAKFHRIPRQHWQSAEEVKQAAVWGLGRGYRLFQDNRDDARSYKVFAAPVASQ